MSAFDNFLSMHAQADSLEQFAQRFFASLGIADYEQRESSNYINDTYFKGTLGKVVFKVADKDDAGNDDLPYWISVNSEIDKTELQKIMNEHIQNLLLPDGFKIARLENFAKTNETRSDF